MNKSDLRKIQKEKRSLLEIEVLSNSIIDNLFSLNEFKSAQNIFAYISFGHEIITDRILNLQDKNIFVPKIVGSNIIMVEYNPKNLTKNKYGVLEPMNSVSKIPNATDLIIVPALACDYSFNRLGYGGGYYDRFLKNTNSVKVSLLPQSLMVQELPIFVSDEKIDIIVTENDILKND